MGRSALATKPVLISPPFKGTPESFAPDQVKARLGVELVAIPDGRYDEVWGVSTPPGGSGAHGGSTRRSVMVEPRGRTWSRPAGELDPGPAHRREPRGRLVVGTCMGWLPRGFPCLGLLAPERPGIPAACDGDMDWCSRCSPSSTRSTRPVSWARGGRRTRPGTRFISRTARLRLKWKDRRVERRLFACAGTPRSAAAPSPRSAIASGRRSPHQARSPHTLLLFTGKIIEVPEVPAARSEAAGRK